ncbi:extracellular solute-binding protein [Paenibacillus sp. PL91]|uniref:extracellular solute-binding protein n=1 Tax=Paenibacillus sp. PL91 TaxID=2729538 RepID=UPI001658ECB7|nr:extracellular solute-binding protein [Paenibacillus sp. PL91]MBC9200571.1 extracellular solute-binding protein [Paenibacillus sp. PL91]
MRRRLKLTMITALIALASTGCASNSTTGNKPANGESAPEGGKTSFSMSMATSGNKHAERSADVNTEKWVLKLEELTNTDLDIKMIPLKDFASKMSLLFASNDIPDVVQNVGGATSKGMSGSVESGIFMPLDDLLKEHAPNLMKAVPAEAWQETSYDGKIYGIPAWLSNPSRRALFIRTDLLEKTGLPAPKTVDEFLDVMRAMKKNGVEFPYQMRENFKYADTVMGAFDVLPSQFELQNGEVVPKFFDVENMSKALETYKTMYDEGLIPKDFASLTSSDYSKNNESGRSGMWSANAQLLPEVRGKLKNAVPDAKLDIIASPRGPENVGGHLLYSSINTSYYINSKVPKEKAISIIKFFEWMLTPEAETYFSFGIEGDTYTKESDGKIKFTPPTAPEAMDEDRFRSMFWFVHDMIYNKAREEMTEDGRDMMNFLDTVVSKEGLGTVRFSPALETFSKYPDASPLGDDVGPKLIIEHMVKMIYGKEPISDWPKVIEEYKKKGGLEIIKDATERYNNGEGVIVTENRK